MMGLLLDSEDRPATSAWEALQPLLPELPERERIAVTMRFCDAVPQSYIAARMGVPPSAGRRAAQDRVGQVAKPDVERIGEPGRGRYR
jgi:DNA-directed RNA polymerase specialized sigma24 family protein